MKKKSLALEDLKLFRIRTTVIVLVIALIFSLLASRLWYLQIINGEKYEEYSQGNRIRLVPQPAPRGIIYDRNGIALADNRPTYHLQLIREDTPDLEKTLRNLAETLDISYVDLKKKVEDHRHQAPFKPVILDKDLEYKNAVIAETYQEDFPGVSIVVRSKRFYPHDQIAAHILGYVGIRSEAQEEEMPENKRSSGHIVGQASMEKIQNDILIGTDGGKQVEVDHLGRELKVLSRPVNPIPGQDIYLTIDARIQEFIYSNMQEKSGAVVVMRPKTGEILGMGSFPSFNPNLFSDGISRKDWRRLVNNPENPLENKAIQGTYPPGSIFKLVTAYAGLDQNIIDEQSTFVCNGYYYLKGRRTPYKCWRYEYGGHGTVDLRTAIKESCNVYFYQVAEKVGIDLLHEYGKRFGFGKKTGISLLDEKSGLMPSSAWKKKTFGERWYPGETPPVAIGQGFVTATPLQVLNFINIIANGGVSVQPRLTLGSASQEPNLPQYQHTGLSREFLSLIRDGMLAAVNEQRGTGRVIRSKFMRIAGKTGTAQVVGHKTTKNWEDEKKNQKKFQNHAWFVAFGPADDPEISVVVLVEHGGKGSQAAGPIAKKILDYYIENYLALDQSADIHESSQSLFAKRLQVAFQ